MNMKQKDLQQMKFKLSFAAIVLLGFVTAFFLTTQPVIAANYTLSGKVIDQSNTALVGSTIEVLQPGTTTVVISTTTDFVGNYSLTVAEGTYNIRVTPPTGSGLQVSLSLNQPIYQNTTSDFTLGNTCPVPNQNPCWVTKAPISSGRISIRAAADSQGNIYVAGGYDGSNFLSTFEMYDPSTNSWSPKAPMPRPMGNVGLAYSSSLNKFYVAGGFNNNGSYNQLFVYDPTTIELNVNN